MEDQHEDKSFRSLMDARGAPAGANPLFDQIPVVDFEIYQIYNVEDLPQDRFVAKKMARRFCCLLSKITQLLLEQTARENNGSAQFLEGTFVSEGREYHYKFPITAAKPSHFAVLLKPMGSCGPLDGHPPIKLIYSFTNMYQLGFVYEEVFYYYEDADISGINITQENQRFAVKMSMDGGYIENEVLELDIGLSGPWQSYDTLQDAKRRTRREVRRAMCRIFVCLSEGLRFPAWACRLCMVFQNHLSVTIDRPVDDVGKVYSKNFNNWDKICYNVTRGQRNFGKSEDGKKPVVRYSCFEELVRQSCVMLLSAVTEGYQKNKQEEEEQLRREREERKGKGKGKGKLQH